MSSTHAWWQFPDCNPQILSCPKYLQVDCPLIFSTQFSESLATICSKGNLWVTLNFLSLSYPILPEVSIPKNKAWDETSSTYGLLSPCFKEKGSDGDRMGQRKELSQEVTFLRVQFHLVPPQHMGVWTIGGIWCYPHLEARSSAFHTPVPVECWLWVYMEIICTICWLSLLSFKENSGFQRRNQCEDLAARNGEWMYLPAQGKDGNKPSTNQCLQLTFKDCWSILAQRLSSFRNLCIPVPFTFC